LFIAKSTLTLQERIMLIINPSAVYSLPRPRYDL